MDRHTWLIAFSETLLRLRPHLSERFTFTLANVRYLPDLDPEAEAEFYHSLQFDQGPVSIPFSERH